MLNCHGTSSLKVENSVLNMHLPDGFFQYLVWHGFNVYVTKGFNPFRLQYTE